jgi:hypothetical protein
MGNNHFECKESKNKTNFSVLNFQIIEHVEDDIPSQIVKENESVIDLSLLSMASITFQEDANNALAAIEERIQTLESEGSYIKESIHTLEVGFNK